MDNKQNYGIVHRMNRLTFIQKALALPAAMLPYAVFARTKTPSTDGYLSFRLLFDEAAETFQLTSTYSHLAGENIVFRHTGRLGPDGCINIRPMLSEIKGALLCKGIKNYEMQERVHVECV